MRRASHTTIYSEQEDPAPSLNGGQTVRTQSIYDGEMMKDL